MRQNSKLASLPFLILRGQFASEAELDALLLYELEPEGLANALTDTVPPSFRLVPKDFFLAEQSWVCHDAVTIQALLGKYRAQCAAEAL